MSTATRNMDVEGFFEVAAGLGPCELIEMEVRMMRPTGGSHGGIAGEVLGGEGVLPGFELRMDELSAGRV